MKRNNILAFIVMVEMILCKNCLCDSSDESLAEKTKERTEEPRKIDSGVAHFDNSKLKILHLCISFLIISI